MQAMRLTHMRVLLSWDSFMPTHRSVDRARLRDFERLLDMALVHEMQVVPVLFAQSLNDTILLPAYAIDRRAPRPGVRVVTGGVEQVGGPRDIWTDPLMLEVQHLWLQAMLRAFANHPAIAAWDLGHDPATTIRPRKIEHVATWLETFAELVRARGDQVWLTLDADDVLGGRAMRLEVVAQRVDAIGLQLFPGRLGIAADGDPVGAAAFTVQLAQRQCGSSSPASDCPVLVHTGLPTLTRHDDPALAAPPDAEHPHGTRWDIAPADPREAARETAAVHEAVAAAGAIGVFSSSWADWGPRTRDVAPADRRPSSCRLGLFDEQSNPKLTADVWTQAARAERAVVRTQPWPAEFDAADYFGNLPESARDLYARWRGMPR